MAQLHRRMTPQAGAYGSSAAVAADHRGHHDMAAIQSAEEATKCVQS